MHHSPPSAITYPSPPALLPTSLPHHQHLPYYPPHCPTTSTCPTTHPALLPTSLPHDLSLPSPQPYDTPHCPTTSTRPTPLLGYLSYIRLPYLCAHYCLSTTALSPATHTIPYTAHTCHTTHRPAHLPHRCTMPPPYLIGSTTQPYLGHLYPPFSSATFIGLIRPIAPIRLIRPTPTRARTGQVVGVIDLIGAIGLIPP